MKPFHVSILAQDKPVYEGEAVSLTIPAGLGSMGILADHMPYVTVVKPGPIVLKKSDGAEPVVVDNKGKGFCEILKNNVTLVLESV